MKKIKVFKGAAVMFEDDLNKKGISISTNTGDVVEEVRATGQNINKFLKNKKYPEYKPQK